MSVAEADMIRCFNRIDKTLRLIRPADDLSRECLRDARRTMGTLRKMIKGTYVPEPKAPTP